MKNILLLLFLGLSLGIQAQELSLKFKIEGLQKDSTVYLGNYLGKSLYYFDTAYVQKNGVVQFKREIPTGVYALITQAKAPVKYFEFLVNNEDIEIEANNDKLRETLKVKKSVENKLFFDYIDYLSKQGAKKEPLVTLRNDETITDKKKEELSEQIRKIDEDVLAYQESLINDNKGTYVSKLISMSLEPKPDPIPEGGVADTAKFNYYTYRDNYWKGVDLKDDALARTPIFHDRLDKYFMKVIPQDPDTIVPEVAKLVDQMNQTGDMFKYAVNHLTYAHVKTKRMGMDKVYVRMAEKFYLTGRCDYWAKPDAIEKMREEVEKRKTTLIGEYAPNIILPDTTLTNYPSLYKDVRTKYTLLYFWDWTCGHCKKETPKLKKFYDSIKENTDIDIEVYAVCTKEDNSGLIEFINKHNLNWINVSDGPDMVSNPEKYGMEIKEIDGQKTLLRNDNGITINYRNTYDVFVTPQLFVLDENKKILAKQISIEQVGDLLNVMEKKK